MKCAPRRILEAFAKAATPEELLVKYVLSGFKGADGDDDVRLQRFITVDAGELEEEKRYFSQLTGCVIKSVQPADELLAEPAVPKLQPTSAERDVLERIQR